MKKAQLLLLILLLVLVFVTLLKPNQADAATITVETTSTAIAVDAVCTLPEAIINANDDAATNPDCAAGAGADIIAFNLGGAAPHTITLTATLPDITSSLIIDGTTNPDASCNAWPPTLTVVINGAGFGGLTVSAADVTVRGLVFNNAGNALTVNADRFIATCNFIGTNIAGTAGAGGTQALLINSGDSIRIGGPLDTDRNLISGQATSGIRFETGALKSNAVIQNNYIGTDVTGVAAIGNFNAVQIRTTSSNAQVLDNLISGNNTYGILIVDSGTTGTIVQGNTIGVNTSGNPLPNGNFGIHVTTLSSNSTIGGPNPGDGNIISSNTSHGIFMDNSSINNTISFNTITNNGGRGIMMATGTATTFSRNVISGNTSLGIDLATAGITGNDVGDGDGGANNQQNFPVLTSVTPDGGGNITVVGTFNSNITRNYRIEFFANASCDGSGAGEGQTFIGAIDPLPTDGTGNVAINVLLPQTVGQPFITATATDLSTNETSEFSVCRQPTGAINITTPVLASISETGPGTTTFTAALNFAPSADVTVPLSSNAQCSVPANVVLTVANGTNPVSVTITAVDDALVDGTFTCPITTGAATSADGIFAGINPANVSVDVTDNDVASINVTAPVLATIPETGPGTTTFTLALSHVPAGNVTVPLASNAECSVPANVVLTVANGTNPVSVTITAVDDALVDGTLACPITTGASTSGDANFAGINPNDVSVDVIDNESASIHVTAPVLATIPETGPGTTTFTVALSHVPSADVTVPLTSNAECSVPANVVLTVANGLTPVVVTITAVDDAVSDGTLACPITTGAATSGDTNFAGLNPNDLSVDVTDNDGTGGSTPPTGGSSAPSVAAVAPTFRDTDFITKTVDKSLAQIGDTLTYTIIFTNPKGITLRNVVITDTFDSRLQNIRVIGNTLGTATVSGNTVTVQGFELLPGQRVTLTVAATISNRANPGDVISNTATLESPDASIHVSNIVQTTILPGSLPATGERSRTNYLLWLLPLMLILAGGYVIRKRYAH